MCPRSPLMQKCNASREPSERRFPRANVVDAMTDNASADNSSLTRSRCEAGVCEVDYLEVEKNDLA